MALIKDRAAPVFDSEQVHKGDLIRAKHKTWDEYRTVGDLIKRQWSLFVNGAVNQQGKLRA